jgi:signal transduction histidine kinase
MATARVRSARISSRVRDSLLVYLQVALLLTIIVVAALPYLHRGEFPNTSDEWIGLLLPVATVTAAAVAVFVVSTRGRRQRFDLVNAYEELSIAVASGLVGDEKLRLSVASGLRGDAKLQASVAKGIIGDAKLRASVASGLVGDEALRVSVASGLVGDEALRVSVASGLVGDEALRVSVASGLVGDEALRVSVASGLVGDEALRVSVASGLAGDEKLRRSVASGLVGDEKLRASVASGLVGDEALRVAVASGLVGDEALRVAVASGLVGDEALRVSVASGLVGDEALRVSVASGIVGDEKLAASVASGLAGDEALRVSVADGIVGAERLRASVADGIEGAKALRLSVAAGIVGAEKLRVSVAEGVDGAEALRVSIAQGLDAASAALAVVDTVDAGITFYSPDGGILLTNDTARAMRFGRTDGDLVFEDDRTTPIPKIDQILARAARGELVTRRAYWVGAGEEQRAMMSTSQYVRRASGELIGTVVATHDVTPLAAAIRSRDEFLETVSHELRTPLTSIIGYLEIIEDSVDIAASGFEHEFDVIQRNTQRLLKLVVDLLTTAEGQASLERRPSNLSELAENSLNAIRRSAEASGVAVLHQRMEPVIAEVDAARISEVFDKLLSNALKFNRPGGEISLTVASTGTEAVVRISDTGVGIVAGDLPHVFERFFRSITARNGVIAGTGLGLSTAKVLVDSHHGAITAESEIGVGTTLEVRLPLVVAPV